MALRSIDTKIWGDTWFECLTPKEKLLFIYFITNDKTNMLGVYETSLRKISFDTGIEVKEVEKTISKFEYDGKVKYDTNRIILLNFIKHQNYNFNMKKSAIRCYNALPKELKTLSDNDLDETIEGFGILCKGFGMVSKIEKEIELELEIEIESESKSIDEYLMSEIEISDVPENQLEHYQIASSFYELFKRNSNDVLQTKWLHLDKTTYKSCVNPIRLLLTNDKRTKEELQKVYKLLQTDAFWMGNIQTTEKLRKQFDNLITRTSQNLNKNGKSNTTTQTAGEKLNARIEANRLRLQEKFGITQQSSEF